MSITRRGFMNCALVVATGAAAGSVYGLPRGGESASTATTTPPPAVLYDMTKCAGCHFCEIACQVNKGLPGEQSFISFRAPDPERAKQEVWAVRRHQCMHCLKPACVSACPVAAMQKTDIGPVIYEDKRCLGCRYCMSACPFGVPRFDWDSGLLDGALIQKCNFCHERQAKGELPACVAACPTGAVTFGKREELLAKAHTLINDHPDRYVPHIYGEKEAGGTSFLLLSGVPFEKLGLPQPGNVALPDLPERVMGAVLPFAAAWAVTLSGITALAQFRARRTKGE